MSTENQHQIIDLEAHEQAVAQDQQMQHDMAELRGQLDPTDEHDRALLDTEDPSKFAIPGLLGSGEAPKPPENVGQALADAVAAENEIIQKAIPQKQENFERLMDAHKGPSAISKIIAKVRSNKS
ncbi:MAG: hypothetical protein JWN38_1212 [Candidatus Saccharibacteria bacterium]|nr:hypothetical protein [Candidatus Saccharibacteria bacterium]